MVLQCVVVLGCCTDADWHKFTLSLVTQLRIQPCVSSRDRTENELTATAFFLSMKFFKYLSKCCHCRCKSCFLDINTTRKKYCRVYSKGIMYEDLLNIEVCYSEKTPFNTKIPSQFFPTLMYGSYWCWFHLPQYIIQYSSEQKALLQPIYSTILFSRVNIHLTLRTTQRNCVCSHLTTLFLYSHRQVSSFLWFCTFRNAILPWKPLYNLEIT